MLRRYLVVISILLFILAALYYITVQSPDLKDIDFLKGNTQIYRDENGLAHVLAQQKQDLFFAIGWAQAQDRLFRLFFMKHLTSGRLAQKIGSFALPVDLYLRNLDFQRFSNQLRDNIGQQQKLYMQSYLRGINQYAARAKIFPFEFYMLWISWQNFTDNDMSNIQKFISFSIQFDWQFQLVRQKLKKYYGVQLAKQLFPISSQYLFQQTTIIKDEQLKQQNLFYSFNQQQANKNLFKDKAEFNVDFNFSDLPQFARMKIGQGSNTFVVSGNRTVSGNPILGNDPHLGILNPSLFYPIQTIYRPKNQKQQITFGVIFQGLPLLGIGVKQNIAWGVTTLYSDSADLYQQFIQNNKYKVNQNQWQNLHEQQQIIKVRGSSDYKFKIRRTRHGPILQNYLNDFSPKYCAHFQDKHIQYSLGSTSYLKNDSSIQVMLNLYFEMTPQKFKKQIRKVKNPNFDMMVIASDKTFMYVGTGDIPLKKHALSGCYVKNGPKFNTQYVNRSITTLPFMPSLINPKRNYIVAANNKFASSNILYHSSVCQSSTSRSHRLQQIINSYQRPMEIQDVKKIVLDQQDSYLKKVKPYLTNFLNKHLKLQFKQQIQKLQKWDCVFSVNSSQALLFGLFQKYFHQKLMPGIPKLDQLTLSNHIYMDHFIFKQFQTCTLNQYKFRQQDQKICGKFNQQRHQLKNNPCGNLILQSFKKAVKYWNNQKWGDYHKRKYKHVIFDQTFLAPLFNYRLPFGGNSRTPNVALYGSHKRQDEYFDAVIGATFRIVTDLNSTYWIIDTGISQNIFSTRSKSMINKFMKGQYIQYQKGQLKAQWLSTKFPYKN